MRKKIFLTPLIIAFILLYRLPRCLVIQVDPLISSNATEHIYTTVTYAFKHYPDSATLHTYLTKELSYIKHINFFYTSFKKCHVQLISQTPLFLLNKEWVVADNAQCYTSDVYDQELLCSLVPIELRSQVSSYKHLLEIPNHIFEHYNVCLSSHSIIAQDKEYPFIEFIACCPSDFDHTLTTFRNSFIKEASFMTALKRKTPMSVDTRFSNRYIVRS